ncbi:MAG TPA: choice-of-anchor Q domain-containing protein [Gemmatimonadaceae bacterium]|nr:choice-of-anchor Q domain-containing protein [Gemmatimonadaceae bacterium]
MLRSPIARSFARILPALSVTLLYGCSDAPTPLEPRLDSRPHTLLAPELVVTNTDDDGPGSLRQTIADAADGSVIHFDAAIAGQTIVFTTGQIRIDKSLTIEGPVPAGMTISGGFSSRLFNIFPDINVVFRDLSLVNGTDPDPAGGGGVAFVNGTLLLDHVLLANNTTVNTGGAIFVKSTGQVTLVNSTVSGNVARSGGAIESGGSLTLWNSTVVNNVAQFGGGLITFGNMYLRNSIVANNTDTDDTPTNSNCDIRANGGVLLVSGTNMSNDASCGTGAGMIVLPAGIGDLADNGGPTKTHALLLGSPAIDAGTSCTEATDQRHVARNKGTSCDIGAFEFTDYATVTLTIGPNVAVNAKTGVVTLTGTVKCSSPVGVTLGVSLTQTQKTTGRFSTIVQASATPAAIACPVANTASSWSFTMIPQSGKFAPGAATGTATGVVPGGFLAPRVTTALKLFQVK